MALVNLQWGRRCFLTFAGAALASRACAAPSTTTSVLGPVSGYGPHTGTLVSELAWIRNIKLLNTVKGLSVQQLDFLLDDKANRIGALLLHLAATEKLFQLNTFDGVGQNDLEKSPAFKEMSVAMNLGDPARKAIQGHELKYYLDLLEQGREKTLAEFHRRDDAWLLKVDEHWPWGPTNNLCKWFHVCEHESHHTGQISLLRSRAPGGKVENG